jgi:hypothetical protein
MLGVEMGAWGWGVFSNDLAADVRSAWREAILGGEDPAQASARIIERSGSPHDLAPEVTAEVTEFWTGLAAAQMETGRLQPDVRDRALAVIAAGGDLDVWEESGAGRQRERVLERLARKLRGPQPEPKRLRRPPRPPDPGVEVGDVLRIFSRDRRRSALFAVVEMNEWKTLRGRHPVVLGLYWSGGPIPSDAELSALPYLGHVDMSPVEGDVLLEHMDGAYPMLGILLVTRRGLEFGPDIGEIVARGVHRAGPHPPASFTGFPTLVSFVGSREFDFCLEATRRRLRKYGDDPRAWERADAALQEEGERVVAQLRSLREVPNRP